MSSPARRVHFASPERASARIRYRRVSVCVRRSMDLRIWVIMERMRKTKLVPTGRHIQVAVRRIRLEENLPNGRFVETVMF